MRKWRITEGVALAVVPVVAYYCAYQFEVGYFGAFAIPEELISVEIATLLSFVVALLGVFWIIYNAMKPILSIRMADLHLMPKKVVLVFLLLVFLMLWALFSYLYESWIRAILPPLAIVVAFMFFMSDRWTAPRENGGKNDTVYPEWLLWATISVIFVTFLSQGIGRYSAEHQRKFAFVSESKNTIALRKEGDYLICTTFDTTSRAISRKVHFVSLSEKGLSLEIQDIGPLRLVP